MVKYTPTIFTNMISLQFPPAIGSNWPVCFELPPLTESDVLSIEGLDLAHKAINPVNRAGRHRQVKKITACPHTNRKHYAKNMCNDCYHRQGRKRMAWACEHSDRPMYAKGKCQVCYVQSYMDQKNVERRQTKKHRSI